MGKEELSIVKSAGLVKPGDTATALITPTGKQVVKIVKNGGTDKYTAVRYPSTGTVVETKISKPDIVRVKLLDV